MADDSYYQPYNSDSGGSDTEDSDSDLSSVEDTQPEPTSFLSLLRTAGPAFNTQKDQLLDSRTNMFNSFQAAFSAPEPVKRKDPVLPVGITKFDVSPQSKSTIINISSTDRDRHVYLNPTELTLHLPREYKNVTGFDIQQIKLLNSFYYFRNDKYNTFYDYIETCRPVPDLTSYPPSINYSNTGYKLRVNIREGSYSISSLLQELQQQLNTPPLFYYYPRGFTDFAELFAGSGNYSLNFNAPGSYYFDSLNNVFVPNPTLAYIVGQYFPNQNASLTFYTNENILIAYYYPVIREIFLDPVALQNLNITNPIIAQNLQPCEDLTERIIYNFQGLNDPVVLAIISDNQNYLDIYRTQHTYLSAPVNEYSFRIDTFNNKLTIYSAGLQKSIQNDFASQKNLYLQEQFINCNLDVNGVQYNALTIANQKLLSTFTQMKDYVYSKMANYFAIPFNSYTIDQLVNYNTLYNLRDGINAANIPTTYIAGCNIALVPDYNATGAQITQYDSLDNIPTQNFTIINDQVCNVITKDIQLDIEAADVIPDPSRAILVGINFLKDSNLQINPKKRSLDIALNINPYEYTILKVNSTIDQTIQLETIPKPHRFRYYDYTQACNSGTVTNYFDQRNTFEITPYLNQIASNFSNSYGIADSNIPSIFGQTETAAAAGAPLYDLNISRKTRYFSFTTPNDPAISSSNNHNFPINISLQTTDILTSPLNVFIYGDKSAYLNDAYAYYKSTSDTTYLANLSSNWLYNYTLSNGSNIYMSNEYQNSQTYYVIVTSPTDSFAITNFNIYTWYSLPVISRIVSNDFVGNPAYNESNITYYEQPVECNADMYKTGRGIYTNLGYYEINDRVYNKLPIDSNLYANTNPENNTFNDPLSISAPAMGYDISNVSTDLTDYKGYNALANTQSSIYTEAVRCDPTNDYLFNALSPYSESAQLYITGTNNNTLLTGGTGEVYTPQPISERQYKIVHWNDTHFIAQQTDELVPSIANVSPYINPYSSSSITSGTLQGYDFTSNVVFGSNSLALGKVSGISFLPTDGSWDIDTFMFKSAYLDQVSDPNKDIMYIGIFETQTVTGFNIGQIDFNNAIVQLARTGSKYYTSAAAVTSNFGFDPTLGSYHFFKNITLNLETQGLISGYTQSFKRMFTRDRNFYSAIAFDANFNVASFYMLTGSLVPHPELSQPIAQATYVDGSSAPNFNQSVIVPQQTVATIPSYIQRSVMDPYGSNGIYMSQYEQSLPIGTQTLQYQTALDVFDDINGLFDYSPKSNSIVPLSSLKLTFAYIRDPVTGLPNLTFTSGGLSNTADCSIVNTFRTIYDVDVPQPGDVLRNIESFSYVNYSNITIPAYGSEPYCNVLAISENSSQRFMLTYHSTSPSVAGAHVIYSVDNPYDTTPTLNRILAVAADIEITPYKFFVQNTQSNLPANSSNLCYAWIKGNVNAIACIKGRAMPDTETGRYYFPGVLPTAQVGNVSSAYLHPEGTIFYIWGNNGTLDSDGNPYSALVGVNIDTFRTQNSPTEFESQLVEYHFGNARGKYITDIKSSSDDTIYFIDTTDPYRIHKIQTREFVSTYTKYLSFENKYVVNVYNVADTASAFTLPLPVTDPTFSWTIGSGDTFFFQWTIDTPYGPYPWKILGNLRTGLDINKALQSAYQIFYPTMKIGLTKKTNYYNAITDTLHLLNKTQSDGSFSPEFNRTYAFYYSNYTSMIADFSNSTNGKYKWGQEKATNYSKADTTFSGYVFNAYIYNILIKGNSGNSYIALRGSRPTESYQTILRVSAPNRIDFGFNSLNDLLGDIQNLYTSNIVGSGNLLSNYNPQYADTIDAFNREFIMTNRAFGQGAITGYAGVSITSSNFSNFMSQLKSYYNQYVSNASILNYINSNANNQFSNYIYRYWSDILPSYAMNRSTTTDPITYSLLFKSSIPPVYADQDEEWGLGWNLGFNKADTPYDTVHTAESFYKIFDDYIFLRLNEEQGMNRVDYTSREHLDKTLDPQGTIQTFYGKLLLNNFGGYSTTFVGNPVEFNPPIGRLDRLHIQWLGPSGTALTNADCEWNAAIRITENIPTASVASTIPSLKTGTQ